MISFKNISLQAWRQFEDVSIDFHPRLTIITGSNGAGKSTILNICSQNFGYSVPFLATPKKKKGGGITYDLGHHRGAPYGEASPSTFYDNDFEDESDLEDDADLDFILPTAPRNPIWRPTELQPGDFIEIGSITYDNDATATLGFREHQAQAYGIEIHGHQEVPGVSISSHRTISGYQPVQGLSLQSITLEAAYHTYFSDYLARAADGRSAHSPLYRMKETLIAMAAFGEGNQHLEKNPGLSAAFEDLSNVLRKVLPREIGFQKIIVRLPDIILKTRSGEFILDASSGGVSAVIEIAWHLFLFSATSKHFVATLDEPENHLHPSMQRTILSNLIEAFPKVQFIVATHSPFIVSAVEDSRVYALKYVGALGQSGFPSRGTRRVRSIFLDQTVKAGSANEILEEVLGVRVSIPDWALKRLDAVILEFEGAEVTSETLKSLRARLSEAGFSDYYPEALSRLVNQE